MLLWEECQGIPFGMTTLPLGERKPASMHDSEIKLQRALFHLESLDGQIDKRYDEGAYVRRGV